MNLKKTLLVLLISTLLFGAGQHAFALPAKSDFRSMLNIVSNVKSQEGRNTCTVFALTAVLESLYTKHYGDDNIDFSEEWVQYLASVKTASGGAKGSTVWINFDAIKRYGIAQESTMPFTSGVWAADSANARRFCSGLSGLEFTRCLYGKRSPRYISYSDNQLNDLPGGQEFIGARQSANSFASFTHRLRLSSIRGESDLKQALINNIPLTLEINIYYGTWNHGAGKKYGIDIDESLYSKGIITYPERGSVDRHVSPQHPARHAVQIIGYDDDVEITYNKKMTDGTTRQFTRRGVYFVKNSWGKKFGRNFRFGRSRIPGLGMISQDYVHDMGKVSIVQVSR